MQTLSNDEVTFVSGGLKPPAEIHPGMDARIAIHTFKGLGMLGAAFSVGFGIGTWLNENTRIQKYIAEALN